MNQYGNGDHDSGVVAYDAGDDNIIIKFRNEGYYKYTIKSVGAAAIRKMKSLAKKSRGLSTFISQEVRDRYESKWE